ncbi:hypothetical protein COU76_00330 [Candidatus Peregrinibacteria bacterium CG10_big_fil_rev_8_21_14_0_10_49_10]|nr:MAG: hypothetical protein COU76_00330 [Candidatus Peregrinibacteria bacterium CG10_big_fil_rev_8_21_14_0_10_49_10]
MKAFFMTLIMVLLAIAGYSGSGLDSIVKKYSPLTKDNQSKSYETQAAKFATLQQKAEALRNGDQRKELDTILLLSQEPLPTVVPAPKQADYSGKPWQYNDALLEHRTSAKAYNEEVIRRKGLAEKYLDLAVKYNVDLAAYEAEVSSLDALFTKQYNEAVKPISALPTRPTSVVAMANCEVPVPQQVVTTSK